MKNAFAKYQGRTVPYTNSFGQQVQRTVNQIEDVFLIMNDIIKLV